MPFCGQEVWFRSYKKLILSKTLVLAMESFYVDPKDIKNGIAKVKGEEFHHLVRVSRKREGELVYIFDGSGKIYVSKILKITSTEAECEIIQEEYMKGEVNIDVVVAQAILKKPDRFEFAVEKLTEIGVKRIVPLITERVIPARTPKDIPQNKIERWKKIILSASKQSNRSLIPELCEPIEFEKFVERFAKFEVKVLLHERLDSDKFLLYEYLKKLGNFNSIVIVTGPEGGFSNEEVDLAIKFGFDIVSLGERRLRSETASIVAMGVLMQILSSSRTN